MAETTQDGLRAQQGKSASARDKVSAVQLDRTAAAAVAAESMHGLGCILRRSDEVRYRS